MAPAVALSTQSEEHHLPKRRKIGPAGYANNQTGVSSHMTESANKNAHLKGRRRFIADYDDLKRECKDGLFLNDFCIKRVRPGDDEGSLQVAITDGDSNPIVVVDLLISDTSEYPKSHSCFCYSPDSDLPASILQIVEDVASEPPRPIRETIEKITLLLTRMKRSETEQDTDDEDVEMDSGSEGEGYGDFEDLEDYVPAKGEDATVLFILQQNFVETVAAGYRPGLIRFGGDGFVVSVSLPVITLAESIPPRALMAWDRRLLSKTQHLTLLISGFRGSYPSISSDGTYNQLAQRLSVTIAFKVGLSHSYKPGKEQTREATRKHGLILRDAEDELRILAEKQVHDWESDPYGDNLPVDEDPIAVEEEQEEEEDEGRFDGFSLSSSLESLLDQSLLRIVQLRRRFGLGWAGAEILHQEIEKCQMTADEVLKMKRPVIIKADKDENKFARTSPLPPDPLQGLGKDDPINLPLTAFCYLVRRLSLCTRYCIVCHNKLTTDYEALKPYVCDSKLCTYQYYTLNRGPSLEYEIIHNPQTVDLLVSLAHSSAAERAMDEPLPVGMALRVPQPKNPGGPIAVSQQAHFIPATPVAPQVHNSPTVGADGLCDFDELDIHQMRECIVKLIDSLPAVDEMKRHLERKVKPGKCKPTLRELDPAILPSAWSILRWCVASCTAHLEEITSGAESIQNIDPDWRQFRFTVGAPDAEAKFKSATRDAQDNDRNAQKYPALFAFHGSALKNWHSIIRHGLWYRTVTNGRAYGDGVYLAKDSSISMGHYSQGSRSAWKQSKLNALNCCALAEIVNLPSQFVSHNPYFVIKETHWIMCRYLLVRCYSETGETSLPKTTSNNTPIPFVKLDPAHPTSVASKAIKIPDPAFHMEALLDDRKAEFQPDEPDEEDLAIFELTQSGQSTNDPIEIDDDSDAQVHPTTLAQKPKDDWKHDEGWVHACVENLMPPPFESTPTATMAVQRELKAMLREQETCNSFKDLGWYMPPDLVGDNLFQWIVEMHSFDPVLPIAKDLKNKKINSVIFEIRFPPTYPNGPPFFRILTPRFLPFIHGGGGHVTGGGSICMDLLTADGWLPSYSISAVLLQIKLAISNLEPRPARLAADWQRSYGAHESLEGFKRAAATHGWKLPDGIDRLVR